MSEILLHHYPQSPVAEKARKALGIKGLAWRSVEVPRIPPKPLLMPLTGGYRRAPVMQIGADIFCDSQCILRELDRRHPDPTFFPYDSHGLAWGFSRWTDSELMNLTVRVVLGAGADSLPPDFAKDRGRLYFGPDHDLKEIQAEVPHYVAQLRAAYTWIDRQLAGDNAYLMGQTPSLADAVVHYLVWFLRGRWDGGPAFLAQFPALVDWETRVRGLGHGTVTDLGAEEALAIAKSSETETPEGVAAGEPQGLAVGQKVSVVADLDGGEEPVVGALRMADAETIAVLHEAPEVGTVCIHFPRAGYRVRAL